MSLLLLLLQEDPLKLGVDLEMFSMNNDHQTGGRLGFAANLHAELSGTGAWHNNQVQRLFIFSSLQNYSSAIVW